MTLEMGESLIASWLKHVKKCQIVQSNWRTSLEWGEQVDKKDIDALYKKIKKSFKDLDLEFVPKKMKSGQLILQGEVDCVGLCLKMENKLIVEKVFAADVAIHEKGLNYGGIQVTCSRIRKKYIRTALTIYQYLGCKEGEIIFATPKVANKHIEELKQVSVDVKKVFEELGFNFDFKFVCEEDFFYDIYEPFYKLSDKISDTSELFLRSLKVTKLSEPSKVKPENNNEVKIKKVVPIIKSLNATQMPIGITALKIFQNLSLTSKLTKDEIDLLCDPIYSKDMLGLPFPTLTKITNDEIFRIVVKNKRYYVKPLTFLGEKYLLCNHWVEPKRNLLEKWSTAMLDGTNL